MKLETMYSTGARDCEYIIGALKININHRHNNRNGTLEGLIFKDCLYPKLHSDINNGI